MAGTRYILANYMRILGLDSANVREVVAFLVRQDGYPSVTAILEGFSFLGLQLLAYTTDELGLRNLNRVAVATMDAGNSYILILRASQKSILYLNTSGETAEQSYSAFCSRWTGFVYYFISPDWESATRKLRLLKEEPSRPPQHQPTLAEIRKTVLFGEPFVYGFCRSVSYFLSYILIIWKVPPNFITLGWLLPIATASWVLFIGQGPVERYSTVLLIFSGYLLDCCDGEVARATGNFSRIGGYLDSLIHSLSGPLLILGTVYGLYRVHADPMILKTGMLCALSGTWYNYLSFQLNSWRNQDNPYASFHPIFRPLFWLFPLDLNLLMIGALFNWLDLAVKTWGFLSLALSLAMLVVFFTEESHTPK
jgi:phosphatidylglycerophosphate synthase